MQDAIGKAKIEAKKYPRLAGFFSVVADADPR